MGKFRSLGFEELCDRLAERKKTLIVYHVRSDADAVGSAFALRELFSMMDIQAVCACSDEVPARLTFISEGIQGSVVLDDDLIIGHERVISVDSASPQQLGSLFNRLHRDIDIMIDHHGQGTVYADYYVSPDAAATAEIIYDIAREFRKRGLIDAIPVRVCNFIYAGITSDTGGFRHANVTPRTHMIAAELISAGADSADINHRLFESKTLKQVKAEGEAARRLRLYDNGRFAVVSIPYSSKFSLGLNDESMETVIDVPRSVAGVEVAVSIRQPERENLFRVSMRSMGDIDVSKICCKFGGGGHMRASGCTLEAQNIEDAEEKIISAVRESVGD